jgi:RNA polymerase sigma-19 factor, ECF subfamily
MANSKKPPRARTTPATSPQSTVPDHGVLLRYFRWWKVDNREDAEDLAQKVQLRLLGRPLDRMRCPQAYVVRTARNVYRDYVRERKSGRVNYNSHEADEAMEHASDSPHDPLYGQQVADEAISALPETDRSVFEQACLQGHSVPEIAADMNLSEHTVVKYRSRAKRRLKAHLKGK